MPRKNESGSWGETLAAKYLSSLGYEILQTNYRSRMGEIDLICSDGSYLVFVEVKTRKSDRFGAPAEYVTRSKQQKIILTAQQYLSEQENERFCRFDVIEIYAPEGVQTKHPLLHHIKDAFQVSTEY